MVIKARKNTAVCIVCHKVIDVGNHPSYGQFIICQHCDTELEIVDLNPIMLDWPMYDEDRYTDLDLDDFSRKKPFKLSSSRESG